MRQEKNYDQLSHDISYNDASLPEIEDEIIEFELTRDEIKKLVKLNNNLLLIKEKIKSYHID